MKKIVLALLLIVNSLFAVTISEIMNADPAYARAFITQVDVRDTNESATKLNTVTYQYWTAGYPYTNLKYNGSITQWYYTFDYTNIYNYSYPYSGWWDQYVNPNDLSVAYIYVNLQGYSASNVYVTRSNGTTVPYYTTLPNGFRVYKDTGSSAVTSYVVKTHIQASDGTVDLYNNLSMDRNIQ
jgi:hypothetical protein